MAASTVEGRGASFTLLFLMFAAAPATPLSPAIGLVLRDGPAAMPFPHPARFWTAAPMTDANLNPNRTDNWLPSVAAIQRDGDDKLLGISPPPGATHMYPLSDTMSTVRILGGWGPNVGVSWAEKCCAKCKPFPDCDAVKHECCDADPRNTTGRMACCNPEVWSDVAYAGPEGRMMYRWPAFFDRLDSLVNNSIRPVLVLDNVDYVFVAQPREGVYGQNMAPDNMTEYAVFIGQLVQQCIARYGRERVSTWWFRVGTEPNTNPGHWNDTVAHYNEMYDFVANEIVKQLPAAVVGPGNFCPYYIPGMGCNRTDDGLTAVVQPIVEHIASGRNYATGESGAPVGFLAASFYGGDGRKGCKAGEGCGYDPALGALAADGLQYLAALSPRFSGIPLQFMEYGCLANSQHRVSPEPGSFGGAWTLASSVQAATRGLSRAFHWVNSDVVGGVGPRRLYYSNAFVAAASNKLFGNMSRAGILSSANDPADTLPTSDTECGAVSVSGLGARLQTPAGGVGLLLSVFSTNKSCTLPVNVSVQFTLPGNGQPEAVAPLQLDVRGLLLDAQTSPFDQLYRDAAANGWLRYDDGLVYPVREMLNPAGNASLQHNASKYLAMQQKLFTPAPVPSGSVSGTCAGSLCTVRFLGRPSQVRALWLRPT